jgi:hypothetical protein
MKTGGWHRGKCPSQSQGPVLFVGWRNRALRVGTKVKTTQKQKRAGKVWELKE